MFTRLKKIYHEFPRLFWTGVAVSFVDRVGGTLTRLIKHRPPFFMMAVGTIF